MHTTKNIRLSIVASLVLITAVGCQKKEEEAPPEAPVVQADPPRYLYVASGACQAGAGVTTFSPTTASNLVFRVDLSTGQRESIIADYNASPASSGDTPVGVVEWDSDRLAVLVGNGSSAERAAPLLCWDSTIGSASQTPPLVSSVGMGDSLTGSAWLPLRPFIMTGSAMPICKP